MNRLKYLLLNAILAAQLLLLLLVPVEGDISLSTHQSPPAIRPGATLSSTLYLPIAISKPLTIRFAVIGDYGSGSTNEAGVADMVKSWQPDFIITVGDNNYPNGEAATIDNNIGRYYSEYIYPYTGIYTPGNPPNKFFPALGNHDWNTAAAQAYFDYFPISSSPANTGSSQNERYYDFIQEPVHFFVLDSDPREPDGNSDTGQQALWLQNQLAASTMPWQVVYFHHAPYSSSEHGSDVSMQWPFAAWGADVVLAGHDHTYERILLDGFPYFVNGLGGRTIYTFGPPIPGSQVRYNDNYGAMLVEATPITITFHFYAIDNGGTVIDSYTTLPGA